MGTVRYDCGCSISRSMFGERGVLSLRHCWQHYHLYSQDKTPRQMAAEIAEQDHTWREQPKPERGAGAYA